MNKIVELVRPLAKAAGKLEIKDIIIQHFDIIIQHFVQLVRENLHIVLAFSPNIHIVLAFSPVGDAFRNRLRMFPSLVNCCTID
ncbi:hypothetical protein T484DRAFT_1808591, partial [Baffinella frigidus]